MSRPTEATCLRCERPKAAISEPEWEPTDDMRAKYRRAMDWANEDSMNRTVDLNLRALHREGLIP